ncbi:MAG: GDSL-type esterase/lipase family protein, partial [Verrucomicrobiota bacterium]
MTKVRVSAHIGILLAVLAFLVVTCRAEAASVEIIALGTSNTYGDGVGRQDTYPAQLETLLRAKGVDARVVNAGVNSDTSARMLARLDSAVPGGSRLVLIEIHQNNEIRGGTSGQTSQNLAAIKAWLQARKIKYIDVSNLMAGYVMAGRSSSLKLPDGRHLNRDGYA